jgi:CDGSH-type Zn-finger protein
MSEPVIAQKFPIPTPVEAGASYYWCACGRSESQPFCDGSHAGSGIIPLPFEATETKTVVLCACKHTKTPPFCDGTHKSL